MTIKLFDWVFIRAFCFTFYAKCGYDPERINNALDKIPMLRIKED